MTGLTRMVAPDISMIDTACIVFIIAVLAFFALSDRIKKDSNE